MNKILKTILVLMALTPIIALAGPFDPPSSDVSVMILNQLFGGLVNGGQDAFGPSITTFNSAILALGGILATYTILAGTLGTAHDGEMLGKKFSSVYIPIRYALGTALVLPVLPGGYCIMQQIVMWLIIQGVGLADSVWTSYLSAPSITLTSKMSYSTKQDIYNFAQGVALAQACTEAAASIMNDGSSGGGVINVIIKPFGSYNYKAQVDPKNVNHIMFGDQAGHLTLLTSTACGEANLPPIPATTAATMVGGGGAGSGGKLGDLSTAFKLGDPTPIYQAHWNASNVLINDLGAKARAAASAKTYLPFADVITAADLYIKSVETAGNAYIQSADPFAGIKTASQQQGWILAGAWYTKLTMLNKQIDVSINTAPTASAQISLGLGLSWLDSVGPLVFKVQEEILSNVGEKISPESVDKNDSKQKTGAESSGSFVAKITAKITKFATGIDMGALQNDPRPAIIILQEAGENMLALWSGMMSVITGIAIASGLKIFGNGLDLNPAVTTIMGFMMAPISAMVVIGFTLAYMLPNLPFLMWIGVVLGWVIMVIEAILAAPLWAVMHLHPNGDDLTGKGANGYMLVLGLILRPPLTIFGLIAALVVTDIMGEFVNKIFFNVFFTGNMSGWTAILGTIFSMGVYTMAMFSLFKKTFSLMHVIPDQLLRWIGGGQEQMGQYAGSIADGAGKGVAAAGAAAGFMGEKAVQTVGRAAQENQQFKLRQSELKNTATQIGNQNDAISPGAGDSLAESREAGYKANNESAPEISTVGSLMTFGNNAKFSQDKMAEQNVTGALDKVSKHSPGSESEFLQKLSESAQTGYAGFKGNSTSQKRIKAAHSIAGEILQRTKSSSNEPSSISENIKNRVNERSKGQEQSNLDANSPLNRGANIMAQENTQSNPTPTQTEMDFSDSESKQTEIHSSEKENINNKNIDTKPFSQSPDDLPS